MCNEAVGFIIVKHRGCEHGFFITVFKTEDICAYNHVVEKKLFFGHLICVLSIKLSKHFLGIYNKDIEI